MHESLNGTIENTHYPLTTIGLEEVAECMCSVSGANGGVEKYVNNRNNCLVKM